MDYVLFILISLFSFTHRQPRLVSTLVTVDKIFEPPHEQPFK